MSHAQRLLFFTRLAFFKGMNQNEMMNENWPLRGCVGHMKYVDIKGNPKEDYLYLISTMCPRAVGKLFGCDGKLRADNDSKET
jgi:hypothetical protein